MLHVLLMDHKRMRLPKGLSLGPHLVSNFDINRPPDRMTGLGRIQCKARIIFKGLSEFILAFPSIVGTAGDESQILVAFALSVFLEMPALTASCRVFAAILYSPSS